MANGSFNYLQYIKTLQQDDCLLIETMNKGYFQSIVDN